MKNNIFSRAWRGELSFNLALWIVQFITTIVLLFISEIIFHDELSVAIVTPYTIYALICVWRCSREYNEVGTSSEMCCYIFFGRLWAIFCVLVTMYATYEVLFS